jgi:hypothetical protein
MKILSFPATAVGAALVASFVGCGGAQPAALPARSQSASVAQPLARPCPGVDNCIIVSCVYKGDHCPECMYTTSVTPPELVIAFCVSHISALGIATGGKFAYGGYGNSVAVIRGKKEVAKLTGLTGQPIGLAVDHLGNVWATNAPSSTISEFANGATKPTATYTDSNLTSASYLAVDAAGDVYVEGQAADGIEVDVLPVGGTTFAPISQPGRIGLTAGGLAVQRARTTTYVWINDQGTSSSPAAISRYILKGSSLYLQGSFGYSGVNGAIWADPAGKHTSRVWAVNNVAYGSGYMTSAIEYTMPGGKIVTATAPTTSSTEAVGIAGAVK